MRLKPFLIFLAIFTVCYIIFFIVYDFLVSFFTTKKEMKQANKLINKNDFQKFANFYGIQSSVTKDVIKQIYKYYNDEKDHRISSEAAYYKVSNMEYVIIILFLEYLDLLFEESVYLKSDMISTPSLQEDALRKKYVVYLHEKKDLETITSLLGDTARNDLAFLDSIFIIPGVRFINSKLYYYGDL